MKKPIIGIPMCYDYSATEKKPILYIFESARRAIQKAGGHVFLIPPIQDVDYIKTKGDQFDPLTEEEKEEILSDLRRCDGFFFPGGIKFVPYNRFLLDYAVENDVPTLGVCLSMQMMSCFQEDVLIETNDTFINHHQGDKDGFCHTVKISQDSKLYDILGKSKIEVNSMHHYHGVANHVYRSVAFAPDGILEAIEHPHCTFNIGVQWHPEKSYSEDENSKKIIDAFLHEAFLFSISKEEKTKLPTSFS